MWVELRRNLGKSYNTL